MKNPRDIYGDGHGFRDVSQGGPALIRRRSEFPHYVNDPIAWAEFPDYE